ncbi:MAG: AAA family ATPase, partial [Prevotella sp.]|nr:AAA family ATPase [Prevotella sp.]
MILKRISILHYKNIQEATLQLSPKMNCFIGHNGEGKTNLLDAVYYLSFCRSSNNPVDSQIINHEQDFFVLEGEYWPDSMAADDLPLAIYCGMKRGTKKH